MCAKLRLSFEICKKNKEILPFVILYVAVEVDFLVPSGLEKEVAYLLLDGWRYKSLAVTIFKIIGSAMAANDITPHKRLYTSRHIAVEDVQHSLCKLYLFILSEKLALLSTHTLIVGIDAIITTSCVRHLLTHLPMQALLFQRALLCKANSIAAQGLLFE